MDIENSLKALPVFASVLGGPDWEDACLVADGLKAGRNLEGLPFPRSLDKTRSAALLARFETTLRPVWTCPEELSAGARHKDLWLSAACALEGPACSDSSPLSRLLRLAGSDRWVRINGDNHLDWQSFSCPGGLEAEFLQARGFLSGIENREKCARHPRWGWLGPDPAWLGTGLRLGRVLFLPRLSASPDLPILSGAFLGRRLELGYRLLPGHVPGAKSGASPWMVLKTRSSLGTNEEGQLAELAESTRLLLHYEREAGPDGEHALRDDRAWRAFGILSNARSLDAAEMTRLAGESAWGLVHGSLDAMTARQQALLFLLAHRGVMEWLIRDMENPLDPGYMDQMRAQAVRAILARHHGRE